MIVFIRMRSLVGGKMFKFSIYIFLLSVFMSACYLFQKPAQIPDKFLDPNQSWVEETLQKMSLDQKIGQLIIVSGDAAFYNTSDPEYQRLKDYVQRYHIGGVFVQAGDVFQRIPYINELQTIAKIPFFYIGNFEEGVGKNLQGGTEFIPPLGVSATGDFKNAFDIGRITATEARAIGYHLTLSPSLNLTDNNPNSGQDLYTYGSDPKTVSSFSSSYIRGLQDNGVMATAKNFPGQGGAAAPDDKNFSINLITFDELQQSGLIPFVDAIKNNVAAIMTTHVAFPNYDQGFTRPATASPHILTELLRKRYHFEGLIISDVLKKQSITDNYYPGNIAVKSLISGVNMLLLPGNIQGAFQAIRKAVQDKRLSIQMIDASVRKILYWKSILGFQEMPAIDEQLLLNKLRTPISLEKAKQIAGKAITLINNDDLPINNRPDQKVFVAGFVSNSHQEISQTVFSKTLRIYYPELKVKTISQTFNISRLDSILNLARRSDIIINTFHFQPGKKLSPAQISITKSLQELEKPVVNIIFGSPYLSMEIPQPRNILFAYADIQDCQRAAAQALVGAIPIDGQLPVTLPGIAPRKSGEKLPKKEMPLKPVDYQAFLPNPIYIDSLRWYLNEAIKDSAFPGAAISVGVKGRLVLQEGFGNYTYDPKSKQIKTNSIFDLASVTKVVSTTTVAMVLYEKGKLNLEWKVSDIIPDFMGNEKDQVTIRHLLTHTSGLPGWEQFYLKIKGKELIVQEICSTELIYQPGSKTVYSDLGMILMQKVLETISQKPLDLLVREYISDPLAMDRTFYNPESSWLNDIVPTEISAFHKKLVRGFVHDENTFVMGGVSGHAGLFSTVEDLSIFCQMYLNGGIYDFNRILQPKTIKMFTARQNIVDKSTRAIGWDTRSETNSMSGDYMSMQAFGHSGFTGTTIWIDPENEVFVVLLTNRVYPTRANQKIRRVRPRVHNYVMKATLKSYTDK